MPIGLGVSLGVGGGKPATSGGAPPAAGGISNDWSCDFDGDDFLYTTVPALAGDPGATFSLWVRSDDTGSGKTALWIGDSGGNNNYWAVRWLSNDLDAIGGNTGGPPDTEFGSTTSGVWYHLAGTSDGTVTKLYLNGSEVDSGVGWSGTLGTHMWIGSYRTGVANWNGLIDEVAIFQTALSAPNIASIYNGGVPGDLTTFSPVGWWRMGDTGSDSGSGAGQAVSAITNAVEGGNDVEQATGSKQPVISSTVPTA